MLQSNEKNIFVYSLTFFITYQIRVYHQIKHRYNRNRTNFFLLILGVHMCQITCMKDGYVSIFSYFLLLFSYRHLLEYKREENIPLSFLIVRLYLFVSHQSNVQHARVHILSLLYSKVNLNLSIYIYIYICVR